ncbi:caspase family protein [Micromonospora sp. WMMD1082]|uniref:caspase family protein n=1 Tax=Micromonospora sp. WMMD1082 TaxID=3016104 RepID=UPI0024164F00|nr:caspase family protein [Micromonospora sp. WMMD1082]MDG4793927.1 caspase family protein [Micromonospora sp. WMMD1082]
MRRALLIGVALYTGGYSDIIGPAVMADVQKLRRALGDSGVTVAHELVAVTDELSSDTIRSSIAEFLIDSGVDDDLIVYFSGHGRYFHGISYLVPSRANPRLPDQHSYLVPVRFEAEIQASPARSVTFLIDACRDGELDDGPHQPPMPSNTATTFVFATQAATLAHSVAGSDALSVFTRALVELLPSLPPEVRLARATALVQERMRHICAQEGLPAQQLDVVSNVNMNSAAFPLFAASPPVHAEDRWNRLLRNELPEILAETPHGPPALPPAAVDRVLGIADQLEAEASARSVVGSPTSPWLQPGLVDRLARALRELAPTILATPLERLLLLGTAAVIDAAFRGAEVSLLAQQKSCWSMECVLSAEPGLKRAIQREDDAAPRLRQWAAHLAAVRECALDTTGDLRKGIADLVRAVEPDLPSAGFGRVVDYLVHVVHYAFDPSRSLTEFEPVELEIDLVSGRAGVNGRRLAAALQLLWRLGLDTRLFEPAAGIHLVHDDVPLTEALSGLQESRWHRVQNLLDLSLWTRSAPIDLAIRQLMVETNEILLTHRQPGGPLHQTKAPHLIATSRLQPERASFRLPHVTFRVSTSETQHLLMGTNLYQDPSLAVRELYQNAVDACRYRERRLQHLYGDEYDWRPSIKFRVGVEGGRRFLECRDNGIGMSHHEVREAFAKAGRRFRDLPEFIQESAEWATDGGPEFQPISQFGIGVLSYFMIADELEIRTARVDRRRGLQPSIRVRIRGGSDLFQISDGGQVELTGGGTIVRLFLSPQAQEFDLAAALNRTVRAPTIPTLFEDRQWHANRLYEEDGREVKRCFSAPDLGVFFHEGHGELLVNGIPTEDPRRTRPAGCTLSLGMWARPNLSVDRRTLLDYDREAVSVRLRQAATRVGTWTDASGNWLLSLFDTDIIAARLAWHALRDVPLAMRPLALAGMPDDNGIYQLKPIVLVPGQDGLHRQDPLVLHRRPDQKALDAARLAALLRRKSVPSGLPPYDDRLAALLNGSHRVPTDFAFPLRLHHRFTGGPYEYALQTFERDRALGELVNLAEDLDVTLGAVAVYAWALALVEKPASLSLTAEAASLSPVRHAGSWRTLAGPGRRNLPVILRDLAFTVTSVAQLTEDDEPEWPLSRITPAVVCLPRPFAQEPAAAAGHVDELQDFDDDAVVTISHVRAVASRILHGRTASESRQYSDITPNLHDATLRALSRDRDGLAPFFIAQVPAVNVAFSAHAERAEGGPDCEQIMAELADAGIEVTPVVHDWGPLMKAIETCPPLLARVTTGDPLESLFEDLWSIAALWDELDWSQVCRAVDLFIDLGAADTRLRTLKDFERLSEGDRGRLRRHAEILSYPFRSLDITASTLVRIAVVDRCTLGEARAALDYYRPMVRSLDLPDALPDDLVEKTPGALLRDYFAEQPWGEVIRGGTHWALRAVRMSAVTGTPLPELAREILPLLAACGEEVAPLDRVAAVVNQAIAFDDLLVLGTQQLVPPPNDPADVAAMCRPFAVDPEGLIARAAIWLSLPHLRMDERDWSEVRHLLAGEE